MATSEAVERALRPEQLQQHALAVRTRDTTRRRRLRIAFACHGLAWAGAAIWLMPRIGPADADLIAFALVAVAAMLASALRIRSRRETVRLQPEEPLQAEASACALAEKHRVIDLLVQTTRQGFWFIDNEGRTTDLNPAMGALLGRPREAVLGHSVFDFFEGPDLATLREQLAARRRGDTGGYEIALVRPDGSRRHCVVSATPLVDAQGSQLGSIGVWTDLTERRENELALRTYEAVANSLTDLVSVVGEDRIYRMVNDAWCRTMGVPREQAVGRLVTDATPQAATPERLQALHDCIATGRPHALRGPSENPRYADRQIETTFYPFVAEANGMRAAVAVTRDVTAQEQARAALAESAQYLLRTLNATGDAIFAIDADPDLPVRFVNDQMLQMWGIPPQAAATLTAARIMAHAEPFFVDPPAEAKRVQAIIASNAPDESRLRLRDGRVLVRRCIPAPIGTRMVRVWSFRDVTAEERALQAVRTRDAEQRALLDAFPGYIARLDPERRYTHVNERMAALIGATPEAIIGRTVEDMLGARYTEPMRELFQRALAGEAVNYDRHQAGTNGRPAVDIQITLARGVEPASGGPAVYAFGIDISGLKRAEQALRASEEAMAAARDEAERANRAKSQFLSQMSHELRTPLNAILGFGQLLGSDPEHVLAARQQGYVREILHGGRHLLDLINDVLDLGSIEAGRLVVDAATVNLRELALECLALVRPLADTHGVHIEPPDAALLHIAVAADRMRLKQVLLNLLANAIKYNRPGGDVGLVCAPQDGVVRLGVRDTGHGLAPSQIERLFQPFERLGAARSGIEGTGIGLALSRRLAEAMGGTIEVTSEVGRGSTFWVCLPLAQPRANTGHEPLTLPGALASAPGALGDDVLYIEDNPVNVMLMQAMLARLPGLRLHSATTPAEGLKLARSELPALILLDIQLPGMDGYEVLRRLHARDETRHIPVIAVTANAMGSEVDAATTAGFAAYLTKPLDLDTLLATVQRTLRGAATD